ncbi:PREDICTED: uncharacterized protein LOC106806144 [Priapulus caudatus]|uniref:Uncharacterized protein LOC106806144 n=1 Tax=Priapulus caudatus TaxID=37621 RepID=A0ABM1DU72_PRICU|nr:PREDICTED: uncharacterized protein LOC106806144 [Priapulus caudatus]XP_014663494.1 PREDICTED: uncharacterized protein LOC106806144 [Priapulus caudatus]
MSSIIFLALCALQVVTLVRANGCYDYVKVLAKNDMELDSRVDLKNFLILEQDVTQTQFVESMTIAPSTGKKSSCGNTRSWICELYEGLPPQYDELKYRGMSKSGFNNYIGKNLVDLFDKNLDSDQVILYKMQIVGPLDHVWLIEQLPGNKYRVYQSYNNAYSLTAWLSDSTDGLFGKHIIIWQEVIDMANSFISQFGCTLDTLDSCPNELNWGTEWMAYIRDYDEEQAVANFEAAWKNFGKGVLLDKTDFYDMYLYKLGNLTAGIEPMVGTTTPWSQQQHDTWISLFASPNPLCYPGVPFNTLTPTTNGPYEMQVKADKFGSVSNDGTCNENYKLLGYTIDGWTDPINSGTHLQVSLAVMLAATIANTNVWVHLVE